MEYDDMRTQNGAADENDWLDVTFARKEKNADENVKTKKNFFEKMKAVFAGKREKAPQKRETVLQPVKERSYKKFAMGAKKVWQKTWKPVAACLVIAAVLVGMRYFDSGFVGDVFGYAKATFTSTSAPAQAETNNAKNCVTLPSNAEISVENGNITLSGGSLAVCFESGKIKDVTESSVTVSVAEDFDIVYSNLSSVMVETGDAVSQYHVLGRYDDNAVVNFIVGGEKVTGVSAEGYVLSWSV